MAPSSTWRRLPVWIATESGPSERTTHAIEAEARKLLAEALDGALRVLETHRSQLESLTELLLKQETVEAAELQKVLRRQVEPTPPQVAAS